MSSYMDTGQLKDDSQSDSQIDSQIADDKDSQLTIARGSIRSAPPSISTLLTLPPDLLSMRQQVFELAMPLTWTGAEYDIYWPFVDNIWVHNHSEKKTKRDTIRISRDQIVMACR